MQSVYVRFDSVITSNSCFLLFNNKDEVLTLIKTSVLDIVNVCNYFAEDMDEATALKNRITNLVGLFAKNKTL